MRELKKLNDPKKRKYRFNLEDAKPYLITVLIAFHILPLFFVFMGEGGADILQNTMMLILNPILIFVIGILYVVRYGFEWKFPLIMAALSTLSIFMYYSFLDGMYMVQAIIICGIVYLVFSYASTLVGKVIRHFLI